MTFTLYTGYFCRTVWPSRPRFRSLILAGGNEVFTNNNIDLAVTPIQVDYCGHPGFDSHHSA